MFRTVGNTKCVADCIGLPVIHGCLVIDWLRRAFFLKLQTYIF